jgi:hypothetical protein
MNDLVLSQIEKSIDDLSTDEQLRLISRVAEKLRKNSENEARLELQIEEMAADEQIRSEIRAIERDFAAAEMDGLDK